MSDVRIYSGPVPPEIEEWLKTIPRSSSYLRERVKPHILQIKEVVRRAGNPALEAEVNCHLAEILREINK